ncbi:MAG: LamG domain protein jellyroll fold domain protein [Acidobacteria bacterium]|nr:LamG domain protein jellyroll fold domain protein [Acidobacteriota bacterium]
MVFAAVAAAAPQVRVRAQDRFLGKEDIVLLGLGLRVEPDHQVAPRDIATIVSTFLSVPPPLKGQVAPFAPDAIVKGTLRGPGVGTGLELTATPNSPFNIPPLGTAGIYTLEEIRFESGGQILMRGTPESVTIEVIDKLLVTQVTARALSAQEIRDKGIVFDKSSFQAYNFTAAFAVKDTPIQISFPVVLPTLQGAQDVTVSQASLGAIPAPVLPELKTIIPDTLRLQAQMPNLKVVGFTLTVPALAGKQLVVPPIPGVVVIPGDIGFLNQFFSVMLLVGNVAPAGSNLVVTDLSGEILLPAGNDTVVGSDDDPLRMAQTNGGPSPKIRLVVQPGADGKLGTADDIAALGPGDSGSAEYLVEGRREGSHVIEFNIGGTLQGLPGGPVQVTGRAVGSVLVRNPSFTLTFTHPETVSAGEHYSLDVTVTNTSPSAANFVSVNLFSGNVVGATVVGDPTRQIDSIPASDSATVSFDMVSRVTGKVTAATLDTEENVQGRFSLKTAVGELGVPLSPDSLILPSEAKSLPADLRTAVLGLLGKAWAVATAPAAALPPDVARISKQIVLDRAVQAAEAGVRISLHEPVPDSTAQLAMDFIGSDFARLAALHPDATDLQFTQADFTAFDELRRRSVRGDVLASAVGAHLAADVAAQGATAFHQAFAEKVSYRPPHLSILVTSDAGPLPYTVALVDAQGRRVGGQDPAGKILKQIPFSDLIPFVDDAGATTGQMIVLAAPAAGDFHLQFSAVAAVPPGGSFGVSLIVPDGAGGLRQIAFAGLTGGTTVPSPFSGAAPYRVLLDLPAIAGGSSSAAPSRDAAIVPPAPHMLGVVQLADKDVLACEALVSFDGTSDIPVGRVVAVLFSEEVTAASVQDRVSANNITNFTVDGNQVVGVALQPGRRVAFLALRDPIGPFVARHLTVLNVMDGHGRAMSAQTLDIETTVTNDASVVGGQVLGADGAAVPFANVRLLITNPCSGALVGISSKSADAQGRFSWDWVPNTPRNRITAVTPGSDEARSVDFTSQRNGQRLNVNVVFLGRGTIKGRTVDENGAPLPNSTVKVTSLTDQSSYGATSDAAGQFAITRVPVGNIFIEGVNLAANAKGNASDLIPLAGASVARDLTLFSLTAPKITVKFGTASGHVLRADSTSLVSAVPVVAYYQSNSQPGVLCPPGQSECPVGVGQTDAGGRFELLHISAGQIRLVTFDQLTFQQGEARVTLPADGVVDANILLAQGIGTVNGTVVDAGGSPVAGARVGGGLSLATADGTGHFVLIDVPVGHRDIVAVSDQLGTKGTATVDIVQAGQTVNVTVVLEAVGTVAGTVFRADGVTPVPSNKVYLFYTLDGDDAARIQVAAVATTDALGHYTIGKVPFRETGYGLSAFLPDFSDGNVKTLVLKFNNQVIRGDIVFRGGGGRVAGRVLDADGTTPLQAAVGISGDQVEVAGGLVGVAFRNVSNVQIANTNITTGTFAFNNIFVGRFTLAAAGQFSPDPITFDGSIPSAGAAVSVDLRLQATSRIQGTVFQPDGVTPVARGVIVRYNSSAFKQVCATSGNITVGNTTVDAGTCRDIPQGIQEETVITDDNGRYLLPLVNAGAFTLTAVDNDSHKTAQTIGAIKPGQVADFSIRLLGLSTLTINVRGSDATTVIPKAEVRVTQIAYPKKVVTGPADEAGVLVLSGGDMFSEGDVIVMATDPRNGFAGRASGRVTKDGDNVTINVFLFNASGTVLGTVFQADGVTTVPNAEVVISNCVGDPLFIGIGAAPCLSGGPLAFGVTDSAGTYREDLIPLGSFRVDVFEAATARRGFGAGRIDLDHQQVPVNVVEAARGLVTGTVVAAGSLAPLKNWEVSLTQNSPGGRPLPLLRTTTGVDGTFSFPGVTIGDFHLNVTRPIAAAGEPFGNADVTETLTAEGQLVDVPIVVQVIEQHHGRVEGIVVNPDGTPAANVAVDVCPVANCISYLPGSGHVNAQTGPDGAFALDNVRVGRFSITARSQASLNATTAEGQLQFEGDVARVTLTLVGLSRVSGTVVFSDNRPAPRVQLSLFGYPTSGCAGNGGCSAFADDNGAFEFLNITAKTYYLRATDPVSNLSGVLTGTLNAGDHPVLRLVLQPTASVTGRALSAGGGGAPRVTAELIQTGVLQPIDIFQVTDNDGNFTFPAVPIGQYTLNLEDPVGAGVAHRSVQVANSVALGDLVLDEAAPTVAALLPHGSAIGVPLASAVRVVFSEPITAGTINQTNVKLTGPASPVLGTLQVTDGDTTAVFTPLVPLSESTRYTLSVQGVTDRVGKVMPSTFTTTFTTVDLTPPAVIDLSPAIDANGIALASVIRVKYSEPFDAARFRGPPIAVAKGAAGVAGRTDFLFGNTTVVFTPAQQLEENTVYTVQLGAALDLAGNAQAQGAQFSFRTLDRTPPQILSLSAGGNGTVIENGITTIVADVGAAHDVSVVDFFINDQPAAAARTAPFVLNVQAIAALGKPGDQIKISALATDTSGNRSVTPAAILVPIVADTPPLVTITAPAPGASFHNGDHITVTVHVTDDLGAAQIGYRARTGKPQDVATQTIAPTSLDVTRTFAFNIAADAVPGAPIVIDATAVDSKGQVANAAPVTISVLDATAPVVTITGTTTGAKVAPGQQTSAVISAQDLGGVASITFTTGGVLAGTQTRTVSPAQNSVVTSFAFTVPATARAGDTLTLDATAVDAAGNAASAARVLLPIADLNPPTLQLHTPTGVLEIVPGATVTVIAQAEDETGVATVALGGQGAFTVSQAKQVSPVSNSAQVTFQIPVPVGAVEGAVLNLAASATDVFGNVSAPATLALTVRSLTSVVLPPSLLIAAGDSSAIDVRLSTAAPAGGLRVDLSSANLNIAQVTSSVFLSEGETVKPATVTAFSGGIVTLTATVNNVQRASMTVTVRGGIVSGRVFNPALQAVFGADVSVVDGNGTVHHTITDANGDYLVEGVATSAFQTTGFSIKVSDPATNLIGFSTGALNLPNGFAHVNVPVVTAGRIGGIVFAADGHSPVGAGAHVDLLANADLFTVLTTVFTDANGAYEFPLVSLGTYAVEASDGSGHRGRTTQLAIVSSGQHLDAPVTYLGRGIVAGTVRDGSGNPAPNVPIVLTATSLFGQAPPVGANSAGDGTFRFDNVPVGSFTVQARDPVTNLVGTVTNAIGSDLQVVTVDVRLATWGGLQGTVYRADGVTPLVGGVVTVSAPGETVTAKTDAAGHYAFDFLPLGSFFIAVNEPATHGIARALGALSVHAQVLTLNLTLLPQGTLVVTVTDANQHPIAGALVGVQSSDGQGGDSLDATTGADGVVLVEHVLATQNIAVSANANGLFGSLLTTLLPNEIKSITVKLQPTGSIVGTVSGPDGQTPVAGIRVSCEGCADTVTTPADGAYRFDNVTLRQWTLTATDAQGRKRAVARNVAVTAGGQVATANLTLVGLGTVTGRVLNPDNSSAPSLTVMIHGLDPDFGTFYGPSTDAAGFYIAEGVVVGPLTVSAGDAPHGLLGEAAATLAHDGDTLTVDILLKSNAITLPVTRVDGNAFTFDIQKDGSIGAGLNGVFAAAAFGAPGGASHLDISVGAATTRFTGANIATTENNGREIAVSQTNVAGLNVTRKVLVAPEYFARYLELLSNPTANPITVSVSVESNVRANSVLTTSSGDAALSVADPNAADRWVALNTGSDGDVFDPAIGGPVQAGFAFDGVGAARRASTASFAVLPFSSISGQVTYGWSNVTIQPGQTVGFMHFVAQQYSRAALQASVDRLAQLPAEALASLSPAEIGAIQNFAIPADGTSTLPPLPPLGGSITGRVFEGDQSTPVPQTFQQGIRYRSQVIFFGRTYAAAMNATGVFTFGPSISVPLGAFTIEAFHPFTSLKSAVTTASFAAGATTAVANVVFSNTGILKGTVRRTSGAVAANATVIATFPAQFGNTSILFPTAGDGSYFAGGLPPGGVTVTGSIQHPQGGSIKLTGTAAATVNAGQTQTVNLTIQPTGAIAGTVRTALGAPAVSTLVQLRGIDPINTFAVLQTQTDSAGVYRFNDVPLGTLTVAATDPVTSFQTTRQTTVVQDQTSTLDLSLRPVGSVQLTVTFNNNAPAVNAFVEIQTAVQPFFISAGATDAAGHLTIPNVPGGSFVVRAHRPGGQSNISVDVPGTLSTQAQVVPIAAVLPPVGTLVVRVTTLAGVPAANVVVESDIDSPDSFSVIGTTAADGQLTRLNILGGRSFRVRADGSSGQARESSATLTLEGETVTVPIVLDTFGNISGRVTLANGAPAVNVLVFDLTLGGSFGASVVTDGDGVYQFTHVPTGVFRLRVTNQPSLTFGSFEGVLIHDGDSVVGDFALSKALTNSDGYPLADANGYTYLFGEPGSLRNGNTPADGFFNFPIMLVGTAATGLRFFNGDMGATFELNRRQLAVPNFDNRSLAPQTLAGLNVTRKLYVDPSGYYGRYLEVFDNPTPTPISVDVQLFGTVNATGFNDTSSGDAALTNADRWYITERPATPGSPSDAHVFQGPNAALAPASAGSTFDGLLQPFVRWNGLTVPAGGRAMLMHFVSVAPDAATARAVAERLAQVPPEALAGLSPDDLASIRNFSVPADGSSPLAPFATVSGRVLANGVAPVPSALVLVTGSSSPLFRPTATVKADANGFYSASTLGGGPFTVQAKDPTTGALSLVVPLSLAPGQTSVTQDLSFTTVGVLRGTVRFGTGALATAGTVTITGGSPAATLVVPIASDGTFAGVALAPGTYAVQATSAGHSGVSADAVVTIGNTTTANVVLKSFAAVRVTVKRFDGSPLVGVSLSIIAADGQHFPTFTNADGVGQFNSFMPEGPFTVYVFAPALIGTATGTILPTDDNRVVDVAVTSSAVRLVGRVFEGDGVTPIRTGTIQIVFANDSVAASSIAVDGSYTIEAVAPGTYTAFISSAGRTLQTAPFVVTPGQLTTANFHFPVNATVRVTVHRDGGAPLPGVTVYFQNQDAFLGLGGTDANGIASVSGVSEGPFTVYASKSGDVILNVTRTGTVGAGDDGHVVDVVIDTTVGNITGTVFTADGVTPASSVSVSLVDPSSNDSIDFATTDDTGAYQFSQFALAFSPFKVIARAPGNSAVTVEKLASFSNGAAIVDLILPIGVANGTVFYAGGTSPAAGANVNIVQKDPRGLAIQLSAIAHDDGRFSIPGLSLGELEVQAMDSDGILVGRAAGSVGSLTTAFVVDVHLAPSGTVTGTVRDSAGNPAAFAQIVISSEGATMGSDKYSTTGAAGSFTVTYVPAGAFSVQSCVYSDVVTCGLAVGVIEADGQTVTADVALPGTGTVSGTMFDADGTTPLPGVSVQIRSGAESALGSYQAFTVTDGNGQFVQPLVPAGAVTVVSLDQFFIASGASAGILIADGSLTANITRGTAGYQCGHSFTGDDGFVYSAGCSGQLQQGGTADGTLSRAYRFDAYSLRVNGGSLSGNAPSRLEIGDRQAVFGPYAPGGLITTRKLFVPTTGGFARFLDTVTNPSNAPVTASVQIEGALGGLVNLVIDPTTTGNTYAITLADATTVAESEDGPVTRPALGHVFAGLNAPVPVSGIHIQRFFSPTYYRWTVTIPAGASVTFMHFALQRAPGDTAGAEAQAQGLVHLTDPNVLAGMTAEEKARVVNFKLQ